MALLGLRGTGSWSADERPKNYREEILYLEPNTKASLMAFLGKLPDQATTDPEFKWFQKELPVQRAIVNGAQTDSDTTIELNGTTPAKIFRKGHVLYEEATGEVMWVASDPTTPWTSISVERGKGTAASAMSDLDGLVIIGTAHEEGAAAPTAISYDPSVPFNYCQIFRNTIFLTKTAQATQLRTGKPLKESLRELVEIHGIEMEKGFIWGARHEDVSGDQPERTTGGAFYFITTNVKDFAGTVTIDD